MNAYQRSKIQIRAKELMSDGIFRTTGLVLICSAAMLLSGNLKYILPVAAKYAAGLQTGDIFANIYVKLAASAAAIVISFFVSVKMRQLKEIWFIFKATATEELTDRKSVV